MKTATYTMNLGQALVEDVDTVKELNGRSCQLSTTSLYDVKWRLLDRAWQRGYSMTWKDIHSFYHPRMSLLQERSSHIASIRADAKETAAEKFRMRYPYLPEGKVVTDPSDSLPFLTNELGMLFRHKSTADPFTTFITSNNSLILIQVPRLQ